MSGSTGRGPLPHLHQGRPTSAPGLPRPQPPVLVHAAPTASAIEARQVQTVIPLIQLSVPLVRLSVPLIPLSVPLVRLSGP